jgi:hypothetical protein
MQRIFFLILGGINLLGFLLAIVLAAVAIWQLQLLSAFAQIVAAAFFGMVVWFAVHPSMQSLRDKAF